MAIRNLEVADIARLQRQRPRPRHQSLTGNALLSAVSEELLGLAPIRSFVDHLLEYGHIPHPWDDAAVGRRVNSRLRSARAAARNRGRATLRKEIHMQTLVRVVVLW